MKGNIQSIAIKNPCTESWDNMQPSATGRYCDSCKKSVIDFTGLSNQQILNQIAGKSRLCGKFDDTQLSNVNRYLAETRPPGFSWKRFGLAAALFTFLPFVKAEAQVKALIESRPGKAKRIFHHRKSADLLVGESLLPKDIKIQPLYSTIASDDNVKIEEQAVAYTTTVGGLVVYPVSFPRRIWINIKWKIKLILGK